MSVWRCKQFFKTNYKRLILLLLLVLALVAVYWFPVTRQSLSEFASGLKAEGWTALGTWLLVVGTLLAVFWQAKQQGRINSASTVMILHDRFESSVMRSYRKQLASAIISKSPIEQKDDHVLVFFETLGMLTHQRILSEDMVWNEFSWEVVRYYAAMRDQIIRLRNASHDRTLYSEGGVPFVVESLLVADWFIA